MLSALRWQKVLTPWRSPPLPRLIRHYLAGQFVSNVLPTTIGGDVLRVSRLSRDTGESPGTFASVVLERLTGWLVLPVITIIGFAVNPGLRHLGTATRVALALAVGTLLLLVAVLVVAGSRRLGGRFAARPGWQRFVGAVHLGVDRLRRQRSRPPTLRRVRLPAGARARRRGGGPGARPAPGRPHRPAGVLPGRAHRPGAAHLDVGPRVREGAFVLFLRPLGVGTDEAVALGLLLYLLNLAVSLPGRRPSPPVGGPVRSVAA